MTPRSLSDDLSPLGHDHADQSNTEDHAFDFTDANYRVVERVLGKYPAMYKKSAIIPLLDLAQRQCGNFLPLAAMQKVARLINVSDIEVRPRPPPQRGPARRHPWRIAPLPRLAPPS